MLSKNLTECKKFILFALFLSALSLHAEKLIHNDGVLISKTEAKMEQMGDELFTKTGVRAYVYAIQDLNTTTLHNYEKQILKNKKSPFVVLLIALKDQKVDIVNSPDVSESFDKEQILSPYTWSGSIIPLLVGKKKDVNVNAAMLNGYADLTEQIANHDNVTLASGIGSTNRNMIFFLRMAIYLFLAFVIGRYILMRIRKR